MTESICKICSKKCKSTKSLLSHARHAHKLNPKEYYDLFNPQGKCEICEKPTSFLNYKSGYRHYCSSKCAAQSKTTKQKREATNKIRYGCANVSQNAAIKQKKVETYKSHIEETKEKVKQTNRLKYGCDWVTQSEEFKQKAKQTNLTKYGVDNFTKSAEYKKRCQATKKSHIQYMSERGYVTLHEVNSKFGTGWVQQNHDKVTTYKNKGYVDIKYLPEIEQYSTRVNSKFQQEVFDFINDSTTIQNTRSIISPYELDIYIPNKHLAIECDGVFWHSRADQQYHLHKTKMCEQLGIHLIHITDWMWNNKQDICKSIINIALNRVNTIYANDCEIRFVSIDTSKSFLDENHIQGSVEAPINIGLYYKDVLVQLISLGKSKHEFELHRACTKLNMIIVGGFEKLMSYLNANIVTYVDRSLFTGNDYINAGWTLIEEISPSYSYYKQNIKLNKAQTSKRLLPQLVDNFNANKTVEQNMLDNGYKIVYDCGTLKFRKECD